MAAAMSATRVVAVKIYKALAVLNNINRLIQRTENK